jgi:hypothetical protein
MHFLGMGDVSLVSVDFILIILSSYTDSFDRL